MKTGILTIFSAVLMAGIAPPAHAASTARVNTSQTASVHPARSAILGQNNTSIINARNTNGNNTDTGADNDNNTNNNRNTGNNGNSGNFNDNNNNTNQLSYDRVFLRRAALDSQLEIALGEVIRTNAQDTTLQQLGQTLIADHTASYQQAVALAESLDLTLPDVTGAQQRLADRAAFLPQESFDRVVLNYIIRAHMEDIRIFQNAALRASNAEVRAYARSQLPVLTDHLVMALEAREDVLANTNTNNTGSGS